MYDKTKKVFNLMNGSNNIGVWKITFNNNETFNIEQSETEGFKNFKIKSNNIFESNEIYRRQRKTKIWYVNANRTV